MFLKLVSICLLAIFLSGCCTQKYCYEYSDLQIYFYGFEPSEIDTIYTTGYEIGSSFTKVAAAVQIDSTRFEGGKYTLVRFQSGSVSTTGESTNYSFGLPDRYEWQIYIPSISRTFLINKYGYTDFKCNWCFPASPSENKKHSLSTCAVNGVSTNAIDIRIEK
ncbi:MAG: hypothetical protein KF744_08680 [Taibaiella sp.]|nr:hypothetical protein [Taibaiella sp.]